MAKKAQFRFNIKNIKYAFPDETGMYDFPKDLAYANSLALESVFTENPLYGDGLKIATVASDQGKTGTLSVINKDEDYEIACGRAKKISGGLADTQQLASIEHAMYYETEDLEPGKKSTIKAWLFGVTSGQAGESYEQTRDTETINAIDYPLIIRGVLLKDSLGADNYTDENGNTVMITRIVCKPGEAGYETFGDSVPVPKALD